MSGTRDNLNIEIKFARMLASQDQIGIDLIVNGEQTSFLFSTNILEEDIDSEIYNYIKNLYITNQLYYEKPSDQDIYDYNAFKVREQRDNLLEETDKYFTISDRPSLSEDKLTELKTYRQRLRDITQQEGFPNNVAFPDKPDFI
jgi:hypothetical protein